jgi:hypothetical protein
MKSIIQEKAKDVHYNFNQDFKAHFEQTVD